eukprot:16470-Heterococcus_DN1.PRE.3
MHAMCASTHDRQHSSSSTSKDAKVRAVLRQRGVRQCTSAQHARDSVSDCYWKHFTNVQHSVTISSNSDTSQLVTHCTLTTTAERRRGHAIAWCGQRLKCSQCLLYLYNVYQLPRHMSLRAVNAREATGISALVLLRDAVSSQRHRSAA